MPNRLIKNSAFLYFRMFVTIGIALFTSRILLKELGVDDFGVYTIVGGVVAMFSSLRGAFASSIQRFLNYEMGLEGTSRLRDIFSMSIVIHLLICVIFLFLAETIGGWFLNNKLIIDPERLVAARWVFQFSILAALVTIMTIPYDALIIANERMDIFAYISILDASLKLGIIFLLTYLDVDKLKLYSVLVFVVALVTRSISSVYCRRKFDECRFSLIWNRELFRDMGSFAGWNFFGNTAFTFVNEGTNILLNLFGGTAANAARGIAYQVRNAATSFIGNIQTAANPQIVKLYAQAKTDEMFNVIYLTSKFSFFFLLIISIPVITYTKPVLELWLGIVPEHSVSFVKLILFFLLIRVFHGSLDSLFKATGKIKKYQLYDSSILLLTLPFSYFLLKTGSNLDTVFIVMIFVELVNMCVMILLAKKIGGLNVMEYARKVILPCILTLAIAFLAVFILNIKFQYTSVLHFLLYLALSIILTIAAIWFAGLSRSEKEYCRAFILRKNKSN